MAQVVAVRPQDVRRFGAPAAILLGQIRYWSGKPNPRCTASHGGRIWVAKSKEEWSDETGLTKSQLRIAFEKLIEAAEVVTERHLHHSKIRAFVRLVDGVGSGSSDYARSRTIECVDLPESTYSIENEIKNDCDEVAYPEDEMGKSKIHGLSVKELAERGSSSGDGVDPKKATKPGQLATVFKHAWNGTFEDQFLPSFTGKQLGQLKQLIGKCPHGEAGVVVDYCVRNWPEFTSAAESLEGAFNAPQYPTPDFLLRYARSAVSCTRDARGDEVAPKVQASKQPSKMVVPQPAPKPAPCDEKASLEEAAKLLGIDDD